MRSPLPSRNEAGSLRVCRAGVLESRCRSPQNTSVREASVSRVFPHHFAPLIAMLDPLYIAYPPKEEVDEYVKLTPEEQHKRLKSIIKKIDLDSDGFLTESKDIPHE